MQTNLARRLHLSLAGIAAFVAPLSAQTPLIEQGRAALARGDHDAAIALLTTAVAQTPKEAEAHYRLGNAYGRKAERSGMLAAARTAPKAKGAWEQAVALNPRHVEARFSLVEFYAFAPGLMGGSYDKAFAQAKEIKVIDPLLGHRAYGLIYAQQDKPGLAKQEYTDALREQPASAKAHSWLGQHFANEEKNYGAAFAEFETALKLDPAYRPAYYHLGRTASVANTNLARGEEALKRYLASHPKEDEPPQANAHYRLGLIYEKEGKRAEAKQSYQEALRLDPSLKDASQALKRVS